MKIGIVGLGKMGGAIAGRLHERAAHIVGWDADPARIEPLSGIVHPAASAADVAERSDHVISIISDDAGVRELFCGPDGFLSRPVQGKLFIEMSTLTPAMARELEPQVTARGAAFVESPVMGTIPRARDGSLLALVGGAPDAVARAHAVLEHLTRRIEHLGPAGSGYTMKLCANLLMGSYLEAVTEALALGTRAGIPLDTVLSILKESPVASPWLNSKTPFFNGGAGDMSLDIVSMRKDMMAAVAAGAAIGVPLPAASGALAALSAAVAHGEGARDLAEHTVFFREHMLHEPRLAKKG
jgi:3-hydroxyisobutyrate dehydrogenase-like beta-hydroxyacid dehydrogenase